MSVYRHLNLTTFAAPSGEITIVHLLDKDIILGTSLQELQDELFSVVAKDQKNRLVLNFAAVKFMSSAALNTLLKLNALLEEHNGKMRLCCIRDEIYVPFAITRLNTKFEIHTTEGEALTDF